MNTIIWKGVSSTTIDGLLICELPPISKPPLRVKETTIDGRDGSTIEDMGYSSYDKTITIGLRGNFDINKVIKYFTGEGEVIFSNEPDKVYTAKIVGQIDYNRLLRFRTAVVKFRVQPFKHKHNEAYKETPTEATTGTSIVVTPNEDDILKSFSIYGKTTQDSTPTPDSPVELVSVGAGGSIAVSVTDGDGNTQTVAVQTPNGLHGIPVSSGGNYTDANGQQWICDEIDLETGLYTQRIHKITSQQLATIGTLGTHDNGVPFLSVWSKGISNKTAPMSTRYEGYMSSTRSGRCYCTTDGLVVNDMRFTDQSTARSIMSSEDSVFLCPLTNPIETALTAEEIETYKALMQNEPTAFTNEEKAYMKVEYFKPFEVFNEGMESSKPIMVLHGSGTVGISVNGIHIFDYTFPEGENEVVIDSEKEDAYLGNVLKNRYMNGEFPILLVGTNKIEWSGYVESIEILPRSRWL